MPDTLEQELASGVAPLGCSAEQVAQLLTFLRLLAKWNRAYNLTAIRDPQQILRLHILDSLSIAPHLQGKRFIDVGTGPGLPGIPLAILFPQHHFTLLDSNGKKIRFIFQAKHRLNLTNIAELQQRVEVYQPHQPYDGVISRAYTSLRQMVGSCEHLLARQGVFYAMKGQYPAAELSELPKHYKVVASRALRVPGVDGDRHLIELSREAADFD